MTMKRLLHNIQISRTGVLPPDAVHSNEYFHLYFDHYISAPVIYTHENPGKTIANMSWLKQQRLLFGFIAYQLL